ncbi:MAG: hypothetical protein AAB415_02210 [Patescibacteria group bacterium]
MNKQKIKKRVIILLILIAVIILGYAKREEKLLPIREEIVDLSNVPKEKRDNRYRLLKNMTETERDSYEKNQSYFLDDNDLSTKVIIGIYKAEDYGANGGIIMLKKLSDGQFSIYWEIKSPFLWKPELSIKEVRDINNNGLKELIIYSEGGVLYRNIEEEYNDREFWVISLNPKSKTYKVLNQIVDEEKNLVRDFDFSHKYPNKVWNRFYFLMKRYDEFPDLFQDKDNDGIPEIILINPALENFDLIPTSPDMIDKGRQYTQIYKWNGSEYSLWKEVAESSPEFKELFK